MDNDNVVRMLEKRLRVERADAACGVGEDWTGSSQETVGGTVGGGADGLVDTLVS